MQPINEDEEETAISAPPPPPSALSVVLLQARRDLWSAQPPQLLAFCLNPLREYMLDPSLAIGFLILLPALLPPKLDYFLAKMVSHSWLVMIHFLYRNTREDNARSPNTIPADTLRTAATNSLLQGSRGGGNSSNSRTSRHVRKYMKPLSDWTTLIQWGVSHAKSSMASIFGLLVNPLKIRSWVDAMSHFNAFLEASGVGGELQEVRGIAI
jgi:hypothetical protein